MSIDKKKNMRTSLEPYNLEHFRNSFCKKRKKKRRKKCERKKKQHIVEICTDLKLM